MYTILLYCTVLYCTVLYYTVLYCTVLYVFNTFFYCMLYCTVLCAVLYCTVLLWSMYRVGCYRLWAMYWLCAVVFCIVLFSVLYYSVLCGLWAMYRLCMGYVLYSLCTVLYSLCTLCGCRLGLWAVLYSVLYFAVLCCNVLYCVLCTMFFFFLPRILHREYFSCLLLVYVPCFFTSHTIIRTLYYSVRIYRILLHKNVVWQYCTYSCLL